MTKWQNKHHFFEHKNKNKFIHYFSYIKTLLMDNSWDINIYILALITIYPHVICHVITLLPIIYKKSLYLLCSTPAKACKNVDIAGSELYTWNGCEQRRGNVSWGKGSLVHANGMTILGKSEICTWHGHLALTKGR